MPKAHRTYETRKLASYLQKRGLLTQYKKAKQYLLEDRILTVRFKEKILKEAEFGILGLTSSLECSLYLMESVI